MIGGHRFSAFVITENEEEAIRGCLESIKWVDELVVVDSYSQDRTPEIVGEYTDHLITHQFVSHRAQTSYALGKTTCDWVLWLDADERLTQEAYDEVRHWFTRPGGPQCDGFSLPRKTYFMDRWVTHGGWYPQPKLRLMRRAAARIGGYAPHPEAHVRGRVRRLKGDILHLSYLGGVTDMMRRSARFAELAAEARRGDGERFVALNLLLKPPLDFLKKYVVQRGFLDGLPGLAIAVSSAHYRFVREVKLWELEHGGTPDLSALLQVVQNGARRPPRPADAERGAGKQEAQE
jgi:glycosyltransferase involved in cell wall biosynthesis